MTIGKGVNKYFIFINDMMFISHSDHGVDTPKPTKERMPDSEAKQMANQKHLLFPLMVRPCSDKAAFEARPRKNIYIDLDQAKRVFEMSRQYQTVVATPHIIIIQAEEAEITLSRDGRMLIKQVSDQSEAAQVADQVLRSIRVALKPK